jgi:hypothetical protein
MNIKNFINHNLIRLVNKLLNTVKDKMVFFSLNFIKLSINIFIKFY